jgi:hypothetical protein
MAVPLYYRSKHGHVFRLQRSRIELADGTARFVLRAIPIRAIAARVTGEGTPLEAVQVGEGVAGTSRADRTGEDVALLEAVQETRLEDVRDRIQRRHMVATPEQTFDQLWQRLRINLEAA